MVAALLPLLLVRGQYAAISVKLLPSGASSKLGFYFAQPMLMTAQPPSGFKRLSAESAEYGGWSFGGKKVAVAEVTNGDEPSGIRVAFGGEKSLATAVKADWQAESISSHFHLYKATVRAPSPFGDGSVDINFYRFDPKDPQHAAQKHELFYYGNYALDGTATLGTRDYHVMIADTKTVGEFGAPSQRGEPPASLLFIDRDGDGKFSRSYEMFETTRPFNIDGVSYEVIGLHGDGSNLGIRRSSKSVAETPMPLGKAVSFTGTDLAGKKVHFPQDFKGKVVMLSFWATTCDPYMHEVSTQVEAYKKLHSRGFEILGVSLDDSDNFDKIAPAMQDNGMTWDQIAERKGWGSPIGKLYGFQAIPQAYLVDGDTGQIYAEGMSLRGPGLMLAVQTALESKGKLRN